MKLVGTRLLGGKLVPRLSGEVPFVTPIEAVKIDHSPGLISEMIQFYPPAMFLPKVL